MRLVGFIVVLHATLARGVLEIKLLQDMEQELVTRVGKGGWGLPGAEQALDDVTQLHTVLLKEAVVSKVGQDGEIFTASLEVERRYTEVVAACSLEALGQGESAPHTPLAATIREDVKSLITGWQGELDGSGQPAEVKEQYGRVLTELQAEINQATVDYAPSAALRLISVQREVRHGFSSRNIDLVDDDDDHHKLTRVNTM